MTVGQEVNGHGSTWQSGETNNMETEHRDMTKTWREGEEEIRQAGQPKETLKTEHRDADYDQRDMTTRLTSTGNTEDRTQGRELISDSETLERTKLKTKPYKTKTLNHLHDAKERIMNSHKT